MRNAATNQTWSEIRVQSLRTLVAEGLSASQIAEALGAVTRNAVIGKVHHLGLAIGGGQPSGPRRRPTTPPRAPRAGRTAAPQPAGPPWPPRRPQAVRTSKPAQSVEAVGPVVSLTAPSARICHWPLGDPKAANFGFCGAPAPRAPYCEGHRSRAYRPVPAAEIGRLTRAARRVA